MMHTEKRNRHDGDFDDIVFLTNCKFEHYLKPQP